MRLRIYRCMGKKEGLDNEEITQRMNEILDIAKQENGELRTGGLVTTDFLKKVISRNEIPLSKMNELIGKHSALFFSKQSEASWLALSYIFTKEKNQRTLPGALRLGGLYPTRQHDKEEVKDFILLTICVALEPGFVGILMNAGYPSQDTLDELVLTVNRGIDDKPAASQIPIQKSQYNKVAKKLNEIYDVTEFKGNLESGTFRVKDPRNIYSNPKIQRADKTLEIQSSIENGSWLKLEYRIADHGYYLGMSKSPQGGITISPLKSDWIDKKDALRAIQHLYGLLCPVIDFRRPIQTIFV